jgi:flagellin-specific chaperone FliS
VKIDGFNREDAAKAVKILQQLETADRRESSQLNEQLRGLYKGNYQALSTWNARNR